MDASVPSPAGLVKELSGNCKAAEELAIETITSSHAPLFNAFRELTRGDCFKIMKRQDIFSILEQAIVLTGLTDYMACAYQNSLFNTFSKKQDKELFPSLLTLLNNKWTRFFHRLGAYDLSYAQLNSIMLLLRHSFKQLPSNFCMVYMMETMIMGQNTLERARLQSHKNITQFVEVKDKQPLKVSVNNGHSNTSAKVMNGIAVINLTSSSSKSKSQEDSECKENKAKITSAPKKSTSGSSKPSQRTLHFSKGPVIDLTSKPAKSSHFQKGTSDFSKGPVIDLTSKPAKSSHFQKGTSDFSKGPVIDLTSKPAKSSHFQNGTSDFSKGPVINITSKPAKSSHSQKGTLDFSKGPVIDLTSEPVVKIQRKKYNADITRYILKSSENKAEGPNSVLEIKNNEQGSKSSSGMELDSKIKDIVNLATPTGKLNSVIGAESPIKKKENKMNAFEEMMKCSRAIKGHSIKRKSLFQ